MAWAEEVLSDTRTQLGLGHLRDRESSHVRRADDNGDSLDFHFGLKGMRVTCSQPRAMTGPTTRVPTRCGFVVV